MYTIYTDGATSKNGSKNARGGYGFVILDDSGDIVRQVGGAVTGDKITNNVCELSAVALALASMLSIKPDIRTNPEPIVLYSDSAYFVNCINQHWYRKWQDNGWVTTKRTPVENKGLWETIIMLIGDLMVEVRKVKGHAHNEYNNLADMLARQGVEQSV